MRVGWSVLKHRDAEGMENTDDYPGRRASDSERVRAVGAVAQGASGDRRTGVILACAIEVHRQLGPGFEEIFYQRALAREFSIRNLDFGREIEIPVRYKGEPLGSKRIDFIVEDVLLEIKATTTLEPVHLA